MVQSSSQFTSSYNPHSDPAERANKQILEACQATVNTVARYDEWDTALPYICFGLNDPHALDLAMDFQNRLRVAADHNLAAQVRLGITLAARSVPAEVKVDDMVWMD